MPTMKPFEMNGTLLLLSTMKCVVKVFLTNEYASVALLFTIGQTVSQRIW